MTNIRPQVRRRLRAVTLVLIAAAPVSWLIGCIQTKAVFEPFSVINVQVVAAPQTPVAGIRVTVSASGLTAGDNDFAFTDATGFAQIRTQKTGFHYIVARHALFDLGYGGNSANLNIGGELQLFQRGRLEIPSTSSVLTPDYFFPFTGASTPAQTGPKAVSVRRKVPGKARFVFFVEDGNILSRTLAPDNKPMPNGKVFVTGDWNNFSLTTEDNDPVNGAKEMVDDGSLPEPPSGDDQIGDGVFTRILDLPPGEHTYMFLQNGVGIYTRDPYEEFSKSVRVAVRTPDNSIANPRELEIREFRASAITVLADPRAVKN